MFFLSLTTYAALRGFNYCNKNLIRNKITKIYSIVTPRPDEIEIPLDKIEVKACRSSGPGGQNVNKLNTKVEIRFNITQADWIPSEVRGRLIQYHPTKVSKEGDLIVTSQEHRYVYKNTYCFHYLSLMCAIIYITCVHSDTASYIY
jgi:protein subunit release factor B